MLNTLMVISNLIHIHTGELKKSRLLMSGSEMLERLELSLLKEVHLLVWVNMDQDG